MKSIILLIFIFIVGCSPAKKAHRYVAEHPQEFANDCATLFPVKDSITKGDTTFLTDTLWGQNYSIDTVVTETKDTVTLTIYKTQDRIVTNTKIIHDTIYRENTAKVSFLQNQLSKTSVDLQTTSKLYSDLKDKWKGKIGIPIWWLIILAFAIGGFVFLRIKNIISPIKL